MIVTAVLLLVTVAGGVAWRASVTPAAGPDTELAVPRSGSSLLGYLAFLPAGYRSTQTRRYPVIVYLHGLGERGDGESLDLGVLATAGLPRLAATGRLPRSARQFIILAPQSTGDTVRPEQVHEWLGQVLGRYRTDRNRLYLTGISMGGQGVIDYLDRYGDANEFAAMVPIAGNFYPSPQPNGLPSCQRMAGTPIVGISWRPRRRRTHPRVSIPGGCLRQPGLPSPGAAAPDRLPRQFSQHLGPHLRPHGPAEAPVDGAWQLFDEDLYSWLFAHTRSARMFHSAGVGPSGMPLFGGRLQAERGDGLAPGS